MNIWMTARQELAQGYKGLWAHILVGCLAVTLADRFGGSPHWAAVVTDAAGVAWEIIGYYITGPRGRAMLIRLGLRGIAARLPERGWVASGLGFLSFGIGTTAGFLICVFST